MGYLPPKAKLVVGKAVCGKSVVREISPWFAEKRG